MSLETLLLSYILLNLYRYATQFTVYCLLLLAVAVLAITSGYFFSTFAEEHQNWGEDSIMQLIYGIVLAVTAIAILIYMIKNRKRIRLIVQLFQESSNALATVPRLLFQPILTFIVIIASSCTFLLFALIIESSGHFKIVNSETEFAIYEKDIFMYAALVVNLIAYIWFIQFILACQHFIIAGTVCQWFFKQKDVALKSPIKRSFAALLRFHLGSICIGSILITFVMVIQMILDPLAVSLFQLSRTKLHKTFVECPKER